MDDNETMSLPPMVHIPIGRSIDMSSFTNRDTVLGYAQYGS